MGLEKGDERGGDFIGSIGMVYDIESGNSKEEVYRMEGLLYKIILFDDTFCFTVLTFAVCFFGLLYAQFMGWGIGNDLYIDEGGEGRGEKKKLD